MKNCIDSILTQICQEMEIILVDDGSDDGAGEICDAYAKRYNRIRVIHKENGGLTSARIAGVEYAKGEYIAFVDGDDWVEKGVYEQVLRKIQMDYADVIVFGYRREYDGFSSVCLPDIEEGSYGKESFLKALERCVKDDKWYKHPVLTSLAVTCMRKKQYLFVESMIHNKEISNGEDTIRVAAVILSAQKLYVFQKAFYHYRMHEGSMSHRRGLLNLENCIRMANAMKFLMEVEDVPPLTLKRYMLSLLYFSLSYMDARYLLCGKENIRCFPQIQRGQSILLYGKGRFSNGILSYIEETDFCKVIGRIDRNDVERIKELVYFDYVLIGIVDYSAVADAKETLLKYQVPEEKICCVDGSTLTVEYLPEELRDCLESGVSSHLIPCERPGTCHI